MPKLLRWHQTRRVWHLFSSQSYFESTRAPGSIQTGPGKRFWAVPRRSATWPGGTCYPMGELTRALGIICGVHVAHRLRGQGRAEV